MIKSFCRYCKKMVVGITTAQILMSVVIFFDVVFTLVFLSILTTMYIYLSYCHDQLFKEKRLRERSLFSKGVLFVKPVQHSFYYYRMKSYSREPHRYYDNLLNPPRIPIKLIWFNGIPSQAVNGRQMLPVLQEGWSARSRIIPTFSINVPLIAE